MTIIWSLLGFLIALGVLVTIHEWGHFITARLFNIKVTHFSIGFGKVLFAQQRGETRYQLALIPLGGYVRFVDEREGEVAAEDLPRAFNRQSVYKRFAVVAAGPVINLLFAWLAFSLIYFSGITGVKPVFENIPANTALATQLPNNDQAWQVVSVNDRPVLGWQEVHQSILRALINQQSSIAVSLKAFSGSQQKIIELGLQDLDINQPKQRWLSVLGFQSKLPNSEPKIDQVSSQSPAEIAGIKPLDKVLEVNNQAVATWSELVALIQAHPGQSLPFLIERQNGILLKTVKLGEKQLGERTIGYLGATAWIDEQTQKAYQTTQSYSVWQSMMKGGEHTWKMLDMTAEMIQQMVLGKVSAQNISGPVSIAEYSGKALQNGSIAFLSLLGLLSLSIGILNLLPIPVLDGGYLFFYVIEMIKGSPVSEAVEAVAQKFGLAMILALTFFALFNDVVRISNG
ncbi:RIP metalloprotease RseP [Hydrogenovibrio sp. SC-1]|uniref:RIP metalloprotease RseP n=1 Tax=Hydrogenovibrio sp. SC-1 TaxID=2065820 RepID=UPI000C7C956C|nr:RIP metalloprotease RseP [Hydrogenovibrio sp. SC-1]PLA73537.1 RIP metalloprotease RseP [Hydrogenovibrio sp. SC-1]